jgi:hypothetical protein
MIVEVLADKPMLPVERLNVEPSLDLGDATYGKYSILVHRMPHLRDRQKAHGVVID